MKVTDGLDSDDTRDALISRFVESRSRQGEFDVVASVVSELRTQSARRHVLESIVMQWADRDLESLTDLLNTLPGDDARHSAVVRLVQKLAPIEPEAARAWADSLPADSAGRERAETLMKLIKP